jgi:hypothetical protein
MTDIIERPSEDDIKAMNIHQRMHALMRAVRYAPKNGVAPQALGSFAYTKHDDLVPLIRPHVLDYRMVIEERVRHYNYKEGHIIKDKYGNDKYSGGLTEVIMDYEIINIDNPEQRMLYSYAGQGVDSQDKGAGKATTYAKKNFYLGSAQLERGEGEDVEAHDNNFEPKNAPRKTETKTPVKNKITAEDIAELTKLMAEGGKHASDICNAYKVNKLDELSPSDLPAIKNRLKKLANEKPQASVH